MFVTVEGALREPEDAEGEELASGTVEQVQQQLAHVSLDQESVLPEVKPYIPTAN